MELRFRELFSFDLWPTNHINFARFHVQTSWFMLYLLRFLSLSKFKRTMFSMVVALSRDIFSFEFVAYQPLQRCQISCANKQQIDKTKTVVRCS